MGEQSREVVEVLVRINWITGIFGGVKFWVVCTGILYCDALCGKMIVQMGRSASFRSTKCGLGEEFYPFCTELDRGCSPVKNNGQVRIE